MKYESYLGMINKLDINQGDAVFISSDMTRLAFSCYQNGEVFNADAFIDSIIKKVGMEGTVIFPTYNWDFCKGITFDYTRTRSAVGSLTNAALKKEGFKRTLHPIYSFAVWGKDQQLLCKMENKSSFGSDSPFHYFYKNNVKNLFIDIDYQHSATFVHYCEEKIGVTYRFLKEFKADYIDQNAYRSSRSYSMYVRFLDRNVGATINPMHPIFLKSGAVSEYDINGVNFKLLDMHKAYDLVENDIVQNNSKNIAIYDGRENLI